MVNSIELTDLNRVGIGSEYDEFCHASIQSLRALIRALLKSKFSLTVMFSKMILNKHTACSGALAGPSPKS